MNYSRQIKKGDDWMEIREITVFNKMTSDLVTKIFEDSEGVKQITSDEYEVIVKLKDPQDSESNV